MKSALSKSELSEALVKLAKNKMLRKKVNRDYIIHPTENNSIKNEPLHPFNQCFTILVCEKLNFDTNKIHEFINKIYDENNIPSHYKHNMILSIYDGLVLYYNDNKKSWCFPTLFGDNKARFLVNGDNKYATFTYFCNYLNLLSNTISVYYTELIDYIGEATGGHNIDEI